MKEKSKIQIEGPEFYEFKPMGKLDLPLYLAKISAGFPSPAEDFLDKKLDLNEHLVQHPAATFFVKVQGNSMIQAGIHSGDVLIVDRALEPTDKKIVVAVVNGELTVKRLRQKKGRLYLVAENPDYKDMEITPETDFEIWGVVAHVIHSV